MGKNSKHNHPNKAALPVEGEEVDDIDELSVNSASEGGAAAPTAATAAAAAPAGVDNSSSGSSSAAALGTDTSSTSTATEAATGDADDNAYGPFTPAVNFLKDIGNKYQAQLAAEPIKTKVVTSCVISLLGEVMGGYIKNRRHHAAVKALGVRGGRDLASMQAPAIIDPKRLAIFGVYGLAITGPMFHWWYAFLDKTVRGWNLTGNTNLAAKILLDRLCMTPPFLLITLVYLNYFQSFNVSQVSKTVKNIYAGALYLNWRVWTVAQAVNFKYVPLEYRVLFGNMVALWWNIVLSLRT